MALYTVNFRQRYYGQLCINSFDYYSPPGIGNTPDAFELAGLFGLIPVGDPLAFPVDSIAGALQGMQNTGVEYLSADVRELYSLDDFYEAAYDPVLVGEANSGNDMSPFTAYGFYTSRVRLDIRRSFKRFVGCAEGLVDAGGEISSAQLAVMTGVSELMSEILVADTASYHPCTIQREKLTDGETGKVSYKLYEDEGEQEAHIAFPLVWSSYTQVRSQTSRQYGRGT